MDTVLLMDDDNDSAALLRLAITKAELKCSLQHVTNVKEAIKYLSRENEYRDEQRFPFPCAVLLDMRLPGENGTALLEWRRGKPELQSVPIVVWSGSEWSKEKNEAGALGASLYIPKPMHMSAFTEVIQILTELCKRGPNGDAVNKTAL